MVAQHPQFAIKFALEGEEEKLIDFFGDGLLASKNTELVRAAVQQALQSKLKAHVIMAEKLIDKLADAIPDDLIHDTMRFLLPYATADRIITGNSDSVRPAWRGLQGIAARLSSEDVNTLLQHTRNYSLYDVNDFVLDEILATLSNAVPSMSEEQLAQTAGIIFPLIDGTRPELAQKHTYRDSINLAYYIADQSSEDLKKQVGDRIFPPGIVEMNLIQLQVMHFLQPARVLNQAERLAQEALEQIRMQITIEDPNAPEINSLSVGSSLAQSSQLPDGTRLVVRHGCDSRLQAAVHFLQQISEETRTLLLEECLRLIVDERNLLSNRIALLRAVSEFAELIDREQKENIVSRLWLLAEGQGIDDADVQEYQHAHNPLNRIRTDMGNPVELQGATLHFLAKIAHSDTSINTDALLQQTTNLLASPDTKIRIGAIIACRALPRWDDNVLIALICGLSNPVLELDAWCYHTLAGPQELNISQFTAGLMLNSMQSALSSPNVNVRTGAGKLVQKIMPLITAFPDLLAQAEAIANMLRTDFSYAVRSVFIGEKFNN